MAQQHIQLTQVQLEGLVFLKGKKFDYLALDLAATLVNTGLVESNSSDIANGTIASRLTSEGDIYVQTLQKAQTPVEQPAWGNQPVQTLLSTDVHFTGHNQIQQPVELPVKSEKPSGAKPKKKEAAKVEKIERVENPVAVEQVSPSVMPKFVVNTVPLPPSRKAAFFSEPKYPFAELKVGYSFFVPNSEEFPNAVRTLQSAASAANNRYAVKTGETTTNRKGEEVSERKYTRKFQVRRDVGKEEDGPENVGKEGARVGRVQ